VLFWLIAQSCISQCAHLSSPSPSPLSQDEKFFLWDIFEADPKMHQLITAMSELAKYHVSVVIDALLRWRSSRMDRVNAVFKSESQKSKASRDASLMEERNRLAIEFLFCSAVLPILDCVGARLADMLRPELCLELENVAFLYFRAPSEGKNSVVGINLDLSPDSSRSTLDLNRKKIPTLYAKLLGTLSRFRLRDIAPRFLKEITSNSVRSRKAVFVIQAIRFVKIQLPSLDGLELASMFVPALLELFKASQRFEVKSALAELVLRLLRPHILLSSQVLPDEGASVASNPTTSVDAYNNWFKLVQEMFLTKAFHYKKKPKVNKELLVNQLMKTAFLVALKRSDFVQHFWPTMLQFLDLLKESKATAAALECILVLLEAYLLKCGDTPNEPVDQRLDEISSQVFTYVSAKRSSSVIVRRMGKGDPADIFVDIICVIARARLKFAMENIIFRMLSVSGKDQFQAERVMVAVLAAREIWTAAAEHRPLQVSKSRLKGEAPQASIPNMTAANQIGMKLPAGQLAPYVDPVAVAWWQLLTHLDNMYGNLLYSTHSKPLLDLIRPEKDGMAIELLRTTIFSIPIIMPKTDDQRLVRLLSKYLIHLDRGIGEMATGALSRLMADRPHFRPLIIQGVSEFVLAIPHNRHDLVFTLLFKLGQLLKRWVEILKTGVSSATTIDTGAAIPDTASAQHQLDTFSIDKVEGTALIFLCSPRAKIRLLALEILRSVRAVEAELISIAGGRSRDSGPTRPSIRVMDILDEVGSDIFKFLQKEQTSFLKTALAQPLPLTVKTLERLAARESKEDQVLWCHALAELLRYVSFSHPAPALYSCSLVLARFQALQPEDSDPRLFTVEQEEMACWWRNYIVFACATVPLKLSHQLFKHGLVSALSATPSSVTPAAPTQPTSSGGGVVSFIASGVSAAVGFVAGSSSSSSGQNESSDGFGGSPEGGRDTPTTIKELLSAITPLLKSSSEVHREAAVLALQRTNAACYEALYLSLRPFEKEFFGDYDKKKKTKRDRLRMEIMSIYTHIAEYARPGTLVANPIVKASFVAFAQDTVMFFATNKNMFEHVSLRYQFTILARRLAEELHSARGEGTFEDDHLRKTLFYVFKKWCGPEVINDEATRKHLNTVLSAVKDPEKRQAYVTALRQHVLAVQLAAFQAMTACLLGPHFEAILPSDAFFPFIHSFLKNSHERVRYLARLMLEAFLQGNLSQPHVLQITLNHCFSSDPDVASNYFLCLVELFPEERLSLHGNQHALHASAGSSNHSPLFTVLLHLVVYMMGDSDYVVRRNAHELLLLIKSLSAEEDRWQNVPFVIESSLHENYERAQLDLSFRLADAHGDTIAPEFVHEMVSRLDSVAPRARRQMLRYALPWLAKLDLSRLSRSTLDILLYDLLMVTLKFESELRSEAEQIWSQIAARVSNLPILINKLLQIGIAKQNPDFIPLAKLICVYCARRSPKAVVDALVAELSSSSQSELVDDATSNAPTHNTNVVAAISVAAALLDGRELGGPGADKAPESPRTLASKHDSVPTTEETVSINVPQKRRVLRRALSSRESSRSERVVTPSASNTFVKSPSAGLAAPSSDDAIEFHGTTTAFSGPPSMSSSPSSAPLQTQSPLAAAVASETTNNVDEEYGGGSGPVSPREEYASDYSAYSQHRRGSVEATPSGTATPGGWATSDDESSQQLPHPQHSHPFHRLIAAVGVSTRSSKSVHSSSRTVPRKPPISRSLSPATRAGAQSKRPGLSTPHGRQSREEDEFSRSAETETTSATASSGQPKGRPFVEESPESASDGSSGESGSDSELEGRLSGASAQSTGALPSPTSGVDNESSDDSMDEEYLRHRRYRNRADSDVSSTMAPESSSAASRRGTLALDSAELVDGGWGLTRGHFTLVILAQLTYETSQCFREHLPIIFHLAFLGLDYRHVLVYEHCRIILLNVIHALVVVPLAAVVLSPPSPGSAPSESGGTVPSISTTTSNSSTSSLASPSVEQHRAFEEGLELERFLKAHANKQLWTNEDIALKKTEIKSAQQVANLVTSIVSVLKSVGIDLAEAWATQALSWAVNCPSWHISGRSFQIYRALHPSMTRDAQNDLLECLLRTLATSRRNPRESLPQSIEILLTFQSLVKSMSSQKLILFPQLFWAAAALAQSDYEQHFFHASQLLLDLLERINFGDRYVQNVFGASVPKDWHPSFPGLQPLVLRGLFSEPNEVKTVQLLSLLTLIPYNDLIHPDGGPLSRFMTNLLALLPYICANYRSHSSVSESSSQNSIPMALVAERLSQAAGLAQRPQLATLFAKVAHQPPEFGSVEEFLQELKTPLGRALQTESATANSRRSPLTPEVAALSLLFSLLESGPTHWRKFLLTIIFNLLSFCVTSANAELEKLLQPRWVSTLLRMVSSSTWRQALPLVDLILQKSSLTVSQLSSEPNSPSVSVALQPRFLNKPDKGIRVAATAVDKLLSTEQRRRMASIDRTVFSVFGSTSDVHRAAEEDKLTAEQQINYLLNATTPNVMQPRGGAEDDQKSGADGADMGMKPVAPMDDEASDDESEELDISAATLNKGTFGRFPTFRGFEELLAKLEALPNRSTNATDDINDSQNQSPRQVGSESVKLEFPDGILKPPSAGGRSRRSHLQWDTDESTDEDTKGLSAAAYRRVKKKMRSSSGDVASVNRRNLGAISASGIDQPPRDRPHSKVKALSARNSSQIRQYLSNDFDPDMPVALSPYSTMRKKLSFSFTQTVLNATRHWRDVQHSSVAAALESNGGQALFDVFPAATKLVAALQDDYASALPSFANLTTSSSLPQRLLASDSLRTDGNRLQGGFQGVPDTVLNLVITKYKRRLKRNPSFAQSFREQRAKLIEDINRLQMAYIEKRIVAEDARRDLALAAGAVRHRQQLDDDSSNLDEFDQKTEDDELRKLRPLLEVSMTQAVVELHLTLLKLLKNHNRLKELVNDILQSDTDTADVKLMRSKLDDEVDANRKMATELRQLAQSQLKKREASK
jgi:hypothetical protein